MVMKNRITMNSSDSFGSAFGGHEFMVTTNVFKGRDSVRGCADNYPAHRAFFRSE